MHVIRFVLVLWLTAVAVTGAANLLVLPWCWLRDHRPRPQTRAVTVRQPARTSA